MQVNREQWIAEQVLPSESVPIPEIVPGGEAFVWQLNGLEKDEFDTYRFAEAAKAKASGQPISISAIAAVFCVKDETGKRLFTTDDVECLSKKAGPVLDRIWAAFMRLNKLGNTGEDAGKNSEPASGGGSTIDSQDASASET